MGTTTVNHGAACTRMARADAPFSAGGGVQSRPALANPMLDNAAYVNLDERPVRA